MNAPIRLAPPPSARLRLLPACCGVGVAASTLLVGVYVLIAVLPQAQAADRPQTVVRSLPPPPPPVTVPTPTTTRTAVEAPPPALPAPPDLTLPDADLRLQLPQSEPLLADLQWEPDLPAVPQLDAGRPGPGDRDARRLLTPDLSAAYPPRARRRGVEGRTTVEMQVDAQGRVVAVQVLASDPAGVFEAAARRAAQHLRYAPAHRSGRPVQSRVRETFVWRMGR